MGHIESAPVRAGFIEPLGRLDHVANGTRQVIPDPARSKLLHMGFGEFLIEGDKEWKREPTGRLHAVQLIEQNRCPGGVRRHEPMARVVTLGAAKERIGSHVSAREADRPNGSSFNLADERAAKGHAEALMRKQDGRCAPRAIKAAMGNFEFDP